jgi:hypothetical protein
MNLQVQGGYLNEMIRLAEKVNITTDNLNFSGVVKSQQ